MSIAPESMHRHPAPQMRHRRVAVVLNGKARAVDERVIRDLRAVLADGPTNLFVSRSLDHAEFIARQIVARDYDVVVCGGGDGTFTQVVSAIAALNPQRMPAFGILRLGTGNALATALGSARATRQGLAADIGRGQRDDAERNLNLLTVEGRLTPFAGVGLDSLILADYNATKRSLENTPFADLAQGGTGYTVAIATRSLWRFLFGARPEVTVRNQGQPAQRVDIYGRSMGEPVPRGGIIYKGPVAIAAASTIPYYGLGLRLFPQVDQRTDRFQLRVTNIGAYSALSRLPAFFRGAVDDPRIYDFLCTEVSMQVVKPTPFQIGGDEVGMRSSVHIGMTSVRGVRGSGLPLENGGAAAAARRVAA
jgi:diacylglycerol kinase family enzyme